jgi:Uncharacterized protein conserved in bacteria (DUF2330)
MSSRPARRLLLVPVSALAFLIAGATGALACGGLVAPGHAEVLQKATTLAAWHDGYEHYVTGFQFLGGAKDFGYIIPLPGVPTKIEKAGDWTLERLEREVNPQPKFADVALAAAAPVQVLQRVRVDALDITVVRGGGPDVAAWAAKNGFALTPDTPAVLGRYSSQGAVFALAKFDNRAAVKQRLFEGQGTVIHFTIPTKAPWIPVRILALGKSQTELVDADFFILSDTLPRLSPTAFEVPGFTIRRNEAASASLLADLRSDRGMSWLPAHGMWLTALTLHTTANAVNYDLSIDGGGPPHPMPFTPISAPSAWTWWLVAVVGIATVAAAWLLWAPSRDLAPLRLKMR